MNNGGNTAFPSGEGATSGLTKRELFAAMAMQGLCADPDNSDFCAEIAASAVRLADCLITALSRGEPASE